jgi:hypothetical protein
MVSRILASIACIAVLTCRFEIGSAAADEADQSASVCRPGMTDDRLMPVPASLAATARAAFQLATPDDMIRKTTVYRCMDGRTLLCTTGANLACGKADTDRHPSAVADWCRAHNDVDFVPMFVTGHDTIYRWSCAGGSPSIAATVEPVDARGFLSRNWKDVGR